jgi:ABC-type amino acid transport substrate-binding protein
MSARAAWTRRAWLAAAGGATLTAAWPALADELPEGALARVRARGTLSVALYNDDAPFHNAGQGIDVALAQAIAQVLGVKASLLPFDAGENMGDDLRNMVWKGHYLGFGPADLMLHVPVDAPLIQATPQARIFAPYYREHVMIARDTTQVAEMPSLDAFKGRRIAVPGQTLAGWLLIGADNGAWRQLLSTQWKDGVDAAQALKRGEVAAAAGNASELQSVLGGDPRYAIEPLPVPRMRDGWAVGCAVKASAEDLARAVQQAVNQLTDSGQLAAIFQKANVAWTRP